MSNINDKYTYSQIPVSVWVCWVQRICHRCEPRNKLGSSRSNILQDEDSECSRRTVEDDEAGDEAVEDILVDILVGDIASRRSIQP